MIDVSIIISHFNSSGKLNRLLASIPTRKNIEIIIVDDNSEIQEWDNITSIKKANISHVVKNHTKSKGAGACRNIGLDLAIGKWVLFADDDDFFTKDMYKNVEGYFSSDYEVVYFTPTSIQEDTKKMSVRHEPYEELINSYIKKQEHAGIFIRYQFYVPWSKLILKELIDSHRIKFDEVIASNDVMFSTKIGFFANEIAVSEEIIYCVTRSKGSLTTTISKEVFQSRFIAFIDQYEFLNNKLSKNEIDRMDFSLKSIMWLLKSFKYGSNHAKGNYYILRNKGLSLMSFRILNPLVLIRRYKIRAYRLQKEKKYLKSEKQTN